MVFPDPPNSDQNPPLPGNPAKAKEQQDLIHLRIKAQVQSTGRVTRLKITDPHAPALPHTNPALVKAVVRANLWFKRLMANPKQSIPDLAKEYGLPSRYVREILRLVFLAPDITEAILNGQQPPIFNCDI